MAPNGQQMCSAMHSFTKNGAMEHQRKAPQQELNKIEAWANKMAN